VAALAGIGFTVSLLIGELAYGVGSERDEYVKVGVLTGSVLAALTAAVILSFRNRAYRTLVTAEELDSDQDGIPDIYEPPNAPST
jgi:NhaA family Na+:H+ antiporter